MTNEENQPNSPIALIAKLIEEVLNSPALKPKLEKADFLNTIQIDGLKHPVRDMNKNKKLVKAGNQTFLVTKKGTNYNVTVKADFTVEKCEEQVEIKKGKKIRENYVLTLKAKSGKETDVMISDKAKTDQKVFASTINEQSNGFNHNFSNNEFQQFMHQFVSNKVSKEVEIHHNTGDIGGGRYLMENACIDNGKTTFAMDNGYIPYDDNKFLKPSNNLSGCPKLAKTIRTSKEIVNELIINLQSAWGASMAIPIIICGYAVMCTRYSLFATKSGFPTLMLFGDSGSGKSTCTALAAGILGYDRTALLSGSSTLLSQMQLASERVNSIVIIDDLKSISKDRKEYSNFVGLIKTLFNGQARMKMSKDQKIDGIEVSSPIAFSSNEAPIGLKEVENRCLVLNVFKGCFDSSKYEYFDDKKMKELSALLPDILKYSEDEILNLYCEIKASLKKKHLCVEDRILNNYAIAIAGARVLFDIAELDMKSIEEFIDKIISEATDSYNEIEDKVESVLSLIPKLIEVNFLSERDIKIRFDLSPEPVVMFHTQTLIDAYNRYYSFYPNSQIDKYDFLKFAKNHKRKMKGKSARINGKGGSKVCFRIDGISEFKDLIYSTGIRQGIPTNELDFDDDNIVEELRPF